MGSRSPSLLSSWCQPFPWSTPTLISPRVWRISQTVTTDKRGPIDSLFRTSRNIMAGNSALCSISLFLLLSLSLIPSLSITFSQSFQCLCTDTQRYTTTAIHSSLSLSLSLSLSFPHKFFFLTFCLPSSLSISLSLSLSSPVNHLVIRNSFYSICLSVIVSVPLEEWRVISMQSDNTSCSGWDESGSLKC